MTVRRARDGAAPRAGAPASDRAGDRGGAPSQQGWQGWDEYAPFYDWENARTLGRRDVPFWTRVASTARGRVLELGCGTGRVSRPLARAGGRPGWGGGPHTNPPPPGARRGGASPHPPDLIRADIRALPFADRAF